MLKIPYESQLPRTYRAYRAAILKVPDSFNRTAGQQESQGACRLHGRMVQ